MLNFVIRLDHFATPPPLPPQASYNRLLPFLDESADESIKAVKLTQEG